METCRVSLTNCKTQLHWLKKRKKAERKAKAAWKLRWPRAEFVEQVTVPRMGVGGEMKTTWTGANPPNTISPPPLPAPPFSCTASWTPATRFTQFWIWNRPGSSSLCLQNEWRFGGRGGGKRAFSKACDAVNLPRVSTMVHAGRTQCSFLDFFVTDWSSCWLWNRVWSTTRLLSCPFLLH